MGSPVTLTTRPNISFPTGTSIGDPSAAARAFRGTLMVEARATHLATWFAMLLDLEDDPLPVVGVSFDDLVDGGKSMRSVELHLHNGPVGPGAAADGPRWGRLHGRRWRAVPSCGVKGRGRGSAASPLARFRRRNCATVWSRNASPRSDTMCSPIPGNCVNGCSMSVK